MSRPAAIRWEQLCNAEITLRRGRQEVVDGVLQRNMSSAGSFADAKRSNLRIRYAYIAEHKHSRFSTVVYCSDPLDLQIRIEYLLRLA